MKRERERESSRKVRGLRRNRRYDHHGDVGTSRCDSAGRRDREREREERKKCRRCQESNYGGAKWSARKGHFVDERVMVRELRWKRSLAELSSGRALKRSAHPRMNGICSKDESKDSLRGLDKSTMTHAGRKRGKSYCADGLTFEPGDLTRALEKREFFFKRQLHDRRNRTVDSFETHRWISCRFDGETVWSRDWNHFKKYRFHTNIFLYCTKLKKNRFI